MTWIATFIGLMCSVSGIGLIALGLLGAIFTYGTSLALLPVGAALVIAAVVIHLLVGIHDRKRNDSAPLAAPAQQRSSTETIVGIICVLGLLWALASL